MTTRTFISLGSNVDCERNLRRAVAALRERFDEVQLSPVYCTGAHGFDGPDFLNAIARIDCDIDPFALHRWLHALEESLGRDGRDEYYSDRILDADIVFFDDLVLDGPGEMQLPRPELRHAFVLKPMADIAPDFVDPIREATMAELWAAHREHDTPPQVVALDWNADEVAPAAPAPAPDSRQGADLLNRAAARVKALLKKHE